MMCYKEVQLLQYNYPQPARQNDTYHLHLKQWLQLQVRPVHCHYLHQGIDEQQRHKFQALQGRDGH